MFDFCSLKNPSYPEYTCLAHCGVLSLDISTAYPHLVVAGLYDGNVAVYNLCRFYLTVLQVKLMFFFKSGESSTISKPSHISSASNGKHSEPVWQVYWAPDNLDGYQNFYRLPVLHDDCSSDSVTQTCAAAPVMGGSPTGRL